MSIDISKLTVEDVKKYLDVVQWAVQFSNHTHSPGCKEDGICDGDGGGVCGHVGFHKELKMIHNAFAEKVGADDKVYRFGP